MSETGQCIQIDHQNTTVCVVLLNYGHPAYLCGSNIFNVKAIRGTVRILGYDLSPGMTHVPAYSFKEFNSLRVNPVNDGSTREDTLYLESLHLPTDVMEKAQCYSHFIVVMKDAESDGFVSFLRNSWKFSIFTETNTDESRMVALFPGVNDNPLLECSTWDELADEFVLKSRKIIVCGGVKVGKSTFMRYLINRHLGRWERVLAIDFDPRHCEFTVMGCLSAVLVDQPLLGPNFSHFILPEKSVYLGNIAVHTCRERYSECVERLGNFCNSVKYRDIPWIINTIGLFITDLGIQLLARIMEAVKPTDIVQIMSGKYKYDFPSNLTPSFFNLQELKLDGGERWEPRLHQLPSLVERPSSSLRNRKSSIRRDIVAFSYLKTAMRNEETDLLHITPKKIKIDDVEIVVVKFNDMMTEIEPTMTTTDKLKSINHNLVALCTGDSLGQLDCLGFGVVRRYNLKAGFIHLITPVSEEAFKRVTVIKMGPNVRLSRKLYKLRLCRRNNRRMTRSE